MQCNAYVCSVCHRRTAPQALQYQPKVATSPSTALQCNAYVCSVCHRSTAPQALQYQPKMATSSSTASVTVYLSASCPVVERKLKRSPRQRRWAYAILPREVPRLLKGALHSPVRRHIVCLPSPGTSFGAHAATVVLELLAIAPPVRCNANRHEYASADEHVQNIHHLPPSPADKFCKGHKVHAAGTSHKAHCYNCAC